MDLRINRLTIYPFIFIYTAINMSFLHPFRTSIRTQSQRLPLSIFRPSILAIHTTPSRPAMKESDTSMASSIYK